MKNYKNGDYAGVRRFEIGDGFIILEYDKGRYLYDDVAPGREDVRKMITLAKQQKGLNTLVSQVIKKRYHKKLN